MNKNLESPSMDTATAPHALETRLLALRDELEKNLAAANACAVERAEENATHLAFVETVANTFPLYQNFVNSVHAGILQLQVEMDEAVAYAATPPAEGVAAPSIDPEILIAPYRAQITQLEAQLMDSHRKVQEAEARIHSQSEQFALERKALEAAASEQESEAETAERNQLFETHRKITADLENTQNTLIQMEASLAQAEERTRNAAEEKSRLIAETERLNQMIRVMEVSHGDLLNERLAEQAKRHEELVRAEKIRFADLEARMTEEYESNLSEDEVAEERVSEAHVQSAARVRVTNRNPRVRAARPAKTALANVPSRKVLVVDDVEMNRVLIGHYFKYLPIDVEFSSNGEDAVKRCQATKFDLIIMDLHLKSMDGIQAVRQIREFEKNAVILAISNLTESEAIEQAEEDRARAVGCNHYFMNGIPKDPFTQKVEEILFN